MKIPRGYRELENGEAIKNTDKFRWLDQPSNPWQKTSLRNNFYESPMIGRIYIRKISRKPSKGK